MSDELGIKAKTLHAMWMSTKSWKENQVLMVRLEDAQKEVDALTTKRDELVVYAGELEQRLEETLAERHAVGLVATETGQRLERIQKWYEKELEWVKTNLEVNKKQGSRDVWFEGYKKALECLKRETGET